MFGCTHRQERDPLRAGERQPDRRGARMSPCKFLVFSRQISQGTPRSPPNPTSGSPGFSRALGSLLPRSVHQNILHGPACHISVCYRFRRPSVASPRPRRAAAPRGIVERPARTRSRRRGAPKVSPRATRRTAADFPRIFDTSTNAKSDPCPRHRRACTVYLQPVPHRHAHGSSSSGYRCCSAHARARSLKIT